MLQFWGPGNFELFLLSTAMHRSKHLFLLSHNIEQLASDRDGQLFVIPFAKSATTGQHSPVSNSSGLPNDLF
jgi:RAB6A-GEF complex partner protein 1